MNGVSYEKLRNVLFFLAGVNFFFLLSFLFLVYKKQELGFFGDLVLFVFVLNVGLLSWFIGYCDAKNG